MTIWPKIYRSTVAAYFSPQFTFAIAKVALFPPDSNPAIPEDARAVPDWTLKTAEKKNWQLFEQIFRFRQLIEPEYQFAAAVWSSRMLMMMKLALLQPLLPPTEWCGGWWCSWCAADRVDADIDDDDSAAGKVIPQMARIVYALQFCAYQNFVPGFESCIFIENFCRPDSVEQLLDLVES